MDRVATPRRSAGAIAGAVAAFAFVLGVPREARAWYFPEHVVISEDAVAEIPRSIRDVLTDAVARARKEDGLAICADVDVGLADVVEHKPIRTKMVRSDVSVACVPYAALGALAADHADDARELRTVLTTSKALELTSAAAFEWGRFRAALERLPNASIERMSFVHDLDVDFYFLDPGYVPRAQSTRAHFVDAGRSIGALAHDAAAYGAVDNALGQFLVHHVRSLESAARGDVTDALLEHAFAVHFVEDAFSAGHLVMTEETWRKGGNAGTRRRHDFFDAKGLRVVRALGAGTCDALGADGGDDDPSPCWTTSGDGWLGTSRDASDRTHAARAVAKLELELAIALRPDAVVAAASRLDERERIAIGELVDPAPWWTVRRSDRGKCTPSAARGMTLVEGAAAAVPRLRVARLAPAISVGKPAAVDLFDPRFVSDALDPCVARDAVSRRDDEEDVDDAAACGPSRTLALGTVGASMLRPILAEWPESEHDAATLEGEAHDAHGFAIELLASANAGALFPPRAPVDFFAPAVGVAGGISYRWGTYLPGRRNRALAELNVGISEALHYDTNGRAGGAPHVTMLDQELRWPVAYEILTSYLLPLDLRRAHEEGTIVLFSGARVHEILTDAAPALWGVELEVAALALTHGHGSYPLYVSSPELRVYVGAADATAATANGGAANANANASANAALHTWGPTIGITLTGGYATFL